MKMTLDINRVITEQEKEILESISKAIPAMSDIQKGYLLGMAEAINERRREDGLPKGPNER